MVTYRLLLGDLLLFGLLFHKRLRLGLFFRRFGRFIDFYGSALVVYDAAFRGCVLGRHAVTVLDFPVFIDPLVNAFGKHFSTRQKRRQQNKAG